MNNWYVYRHIRKDINVPFYIGIGCKKDYARAFDLSSSKRNEIWNKIFNKTSVDVEIIFDELTKEEASLKEQEFIRLYGRIDLSTGSLSNLTDGGDGVWGIIFSDSRKDKIRQSKIGSLNPMYGKNVPDTTRQKRAKAMTGRKHSEERNKMQSLANTQRRPIMMYNFRTKEVIGTYHSMSEACRQIGACTSKASIIARRTSNRKQTRGFGFIYLDDYEGLADFDRAKKALGI